MTTTTTFTISANGTLLVRERDTDADGNVTRNHRSSYVPGSDISAQSQEVQDAAVAAWTPEVLAAYQASLPVPTPEELRAIAQAEADAQAKAEAKADNVIQYLRDHTPAECEAYVQAQVTDLASAKQLMKKFAVALCVLAKQSLR